SCLTLQERMRKGMTIATSVVSVRLHPATKTKPPGRKLPMNRRELLKAAAVLPLAQVALPNPGFAQAAWPARNITMIVPFPAGGQADLAARPTAQALEKILGKSVIVDNRAGGAGGSIGNAAAARRARWLHIADDAVVAGGVAGSRPAVRPTRA